MTAVAEIRYVALKAIPVEVDGDRQVLSPGEEVPAELVGSWCEMAVESGKLIAVPYLSDEEFALEAATRGYELKPLKQKD